MSGESTFEALPDEVIHEKRGRVLTVKRAIETDANGEKWIRTFVTVSRNGKPIDYGNYKQKCKESPNANN